MIKDYEEIKRLCEEDAFGIRFGRDLFLKYMIQMFRGSLPCIIQRRWCLWIAEAGAGEYITCDKPVSFYGLMPATELTGRGLDDPRSLLIVPLSATLAAEGRYAPVPSVQYANRRLVAEMNGLIGANANRVVYSAQADFEWSMPGLGAIMKRGDMVNQRRNIPTTRRAVER